MQKKILNSEVIEIVSEYGIIKSKEELLFDNGKSLNVVETWYDVALEHGDGDIVYSCDTLKEAKKWIKEN